LERISYSTALRFGQKSVDIRFVVFFCILRLGMSERKDSEFRRRVCEQLFAFAFPFFGLELDQKNLEVIFNYTVGTVDRKRC
jgi:hypothetical protein